MTFPSIQAPDTPIKVTSTQKRVSTESESGYTRTRNRSVKPFKMFYLSWKVLSIADLTTLLSFVESIGGDAFIWTHPITNDDYTVILAEDTFTYEYKGFYTTVDSLVLREV